MAYEAVHGEDALEFLQTWVQVQALSLTWCALVSYSAYLRLRLLRIIKLLTS